MQVGFVEQQKLHTNYHRTAYNYTYPTDPKFYKQWSLVSNYSIESWSFPHYNTITHLNSIILEIFFLWQLNTGRVSGAPYSGKDLNVEPAWMQGITGKGVVVSVFDDGTSIATPKHLPILLSLQS